MSTFSDLESLLALTSALDSGKLEEVYASVATHIGAQGATKVSEAVVELHAIGVDPSMYIAPTRYHQRRQRELSRMSAEEFKLQAAKDLHDVELRRQIAEVERLEAGTALAKAEAARLTKDTTVTV